MNPPPKPPPPDAPPDLETRIALAEQRLVARERRLHGEFETAVQALQHYAHPKRWLWPAVGALTSAMLLGMALRPGGGTRPTPAHHDEMPWLHWIGFAWPLLPAAWRARLSPGTATAVLALAVPALEGLLGAFRRRRQAGGRRR